MIYIYSEINLIKPILNCTQDFSLVDKKTGITVWSQCYQSVITDIV